MTSNELSLLCAKAREAADAMLSVRWMFMEKNRAADGVWTCGLIRAVREMPPGLCGGRKLGRYLKGPVLGEPRQMQQVEADFELPRLPDYRWWVLRLVWFRSSLWQVLYADSGYFNMHDRFHGLAGYNKPFFHDPDLFHALWTVLTDLADTLSWRCLDPHPDNNTWLATACRFFVLARFSAARMLWSDLTRTESALPDSTTVLEVYKAFRGRVAGPAQCRLMSGDTS